MEILVIPSNPIGDTIMHSGIIHYLRKLYPDARFHLALNDEKKELFQDFPQPFTIYTFNKQKNNMHWWHLYNYARKYKWEIIINLRRSLIPYCLRVKTVYTIGKSPTIGHNCLLSVKFFNKLLLPHVWFKKANEQHKQAMSKSQYWLYFGIASNHMSRTWPWQRFYSLAKFILDSYPQCGIIFAASKQTRGVVDLEQLDQLVKKYNSRIIDAIGLYSLGESVAFMDNSDFVVSVDSGPLHIASALNKPILALFGITSEEQTGPFKMNDSHEIHIIRAVPPLTQTQRIKLDHDKYSDEMLAITTDMVINKMNEILEAKLIKSS